MLVDKDTPWEDIQKYLDENPSGETYFECPGCRRRYPTQATFYADDHEFKQDECRRCVKKKRGRIMKSDILQLGHLRQEAKRSGYKGGLRPTEVVIKQTGGKFGAAVRSARMQIATPKWVNHSEMQEIQRECQRVSKETGVKHHVDHVVPIAHHNVCGLNVPWNLQIIPAEDNLRKSNKFDIGC